MQLACNMLRYLLYYMSATATLFVMQLWERPAVRAAQLPFGGRWGKGYDMLLRFYSMEQYPEVGCLSLAGAGELYLCVRRREVYLSWQLKHVQSMPICLQET
jgi:hypothetical protein